MLYIELRFNFLELDVTETVSRAGIATKNSKQKNYSASSIIRSSWATFFENLNRINIWRPKKYLSFGTHHPTITMNHGDLEKPAMSTNRERFD